MFLVLNKQKIYTYVVSLVTVVILFGVAGGITEKQNTQKENSAITTSATTGTKLLPIYNVKTEEKKVALTMNCAW